MRRFESGGAQVRERGEVVSAPVLCDVPSFDRRVHGKGTFDATCVDDVAEAFDESCFGRPMS